MKKKNRCPYKALIVVVNEGKVYEEKVLSVLKKYDISRSMISLAKGTAPSNLSDFFGFSVDNKSMVSTFIDSDKTEEIIADLKKELESDAKNRGLIVTLPITALSSNILGLWRNSDENGEKELAQRENNQKNENSEA